MIRAVASVRTRWAEAAFAAAQPIQRGAVVHKQYLSAIRGRPGPRPPQRSRDVVAA
jgi:hypothetical protein